jgi:1-acyl-sn-glycerol-3-phosphate acyltransferase
MYIPAFPEVRPFLWVAFNFYERLKMDGRENIPLRGPFVICSNHASYLDPLVLGYVSIRRRIGYMAKEELFRVPVFGSMIRFWGAFPVKRNARDDGAIRAFHDFLHQDKPLTVFIEGTRTHNGDLQPPKKGVGKLLYHARVPVLPAYLHGTYDAWPRHRKFPRPARMHAVIGKPIPLDDLYALPDEKSTYKAIAERVMGEIRTIRDARFGPFQGPPSQTVASVD